LTSATAGATCKPQQSLDKTEGKYAGWMQAVLKCTAAHPVKATGTPITVGFLNSQGDPAGSFPDVTAGAEATVDYINNQLGGLGGNPLTGKPGRPIDLKTCFMTITPSSTTSCANQLVSDHPVFIWEGYQFFGQIADPIFQAAHIPVINFSPITVSDFTSPVLLDIAAGGGCVGAHPGLIDFAVYKLKAKNLAIPWANTPPGVECYYDLEKKPVDAINGSLKPTPKGVKVIASVKEDGYPIAAGAPDDSSQAAQILAQNPQVIIFSGQSSDCFNLLSALSNLGWTAKKIPLVFSGACSNVQSFQQAGAKADGIYVVGAAYNLLDPTSATGLIRQEIAAIDSADAKYQPSQSPTGIEAAMFQTEMTTWLTLDNSSAANKLTSADVLSTLRNTTKVHMFAGLPWGCTSAPKPYVSVCSTAVSALQWNGTGFVNVGKPFDGAYLINGLPIKSSASSYGS
jgi:branched-chain amino acid transport system substrate-binding protein